MPYVSDLLGKPVADVEGECIGRLEDLVATVHPGMPHPEIVAIVVKRPSRMLLRIPISAVAVLFAPAIPLNQPLEQIVPYEPGEQDLNLAMEVLDKQIIDTDGMRVVRVNDLELARVNGHVYVANVDIGSLGLLRRMRLARQAQRLAGLLRRQVRSTIISWDDVELLPGDQPMRLKVTMEALSDLHPADLAEILSDLSRSESSKLIESLDVKTLADTLEEVEPDFQASLVEEMADEKVADVLEEMAPDEAADLLAELPEDRSQELLSLMEKKDAEGVRRLLAYPEDTAGGLMNTEFVSVGPDLTAEQVLAVLRETAHEAESIFYIYVTDKDNHLIGDFSLQDLVLVRPDTPVHDFMNHRVVSLKVDDSQDEAAQAAAKYDLLMMPVVDHEGRIQGIVTAEDALDKIIPTAWKKRLPRLYY